MMASDHHDRPAPFGPDGLELKRAFGSFATGVCVVTTTRPDGRPIGLTVNSLSSVSLQPPLLLWCLNKRSPNLVAFRDARVHAVSILAEHQHALAQQFGRASDDKFEGVAVRAGPHGVPLLCDAIATFECENLQHHDGGDHLIFVARVLQFDVDLETHAPLVCHRSRFVRIAPAALP